MDLKPMALRDVAHDCAKLGFGGFCRARTELVDDDQLFLISHFDGEGGAASRAQRDAAILDRRFDILRKVIHAADDDEVFEATADKQHSLADESEVTAA